MKGLKNTMKNRKWEPKNQTTKNNSLIFKVTATEKEQIAKAAHKAGMTLSNYLRSTCFQERIVVITEGREILKTMQEIRNILRPLGDMPQVGEIENQLSQVTAKLHSCLTRQ